MQIREATLPAPNAVKISLPLIFFVIIYPNHVTLLMNNELIVLANSLTNDHVRTLEFC